MDHLYAKNCFKITERVEHSNFSATVYNILCVFGNFYLQYDTPFSNQAATISNTDSFDVGTVFFYLITNHLTIDRL